MVLATELVSVPGVWLLLAALAECWLLAPVLIGKDALPEALTLLRD